jgi:NTP pyrophosphatase (non-canonical NTP hydrolase)
MAHEVWIGLASLQEEAHEYAMSKGFWDHDDKSHQVDSEKIALMHSELSEALSAIRDEDWDAVEMELVDCVFRIADYCERRGLQLNRGLNRVRAKNKERPVLHGRKW